MKAIVDKDACISCGLCVNTCEEVFQWDEDDKAHVVMEDVSEYEDLVKDAAGSCPTEAIHVE